MARPIGSGKGKAKDKTAEKNETVKISDKEEIKSAENITEPLTEQNVDQKDYNSHNFEIDGPMPEIIPEQKVKKQTINFSKLDQIDIFEENEDEDVLFTQLMIIVGFIAIIGFILIVVIVIIGASHHSKTKEEIMQELKNEFKETPPQKKTIQPTQTNKIQKYK